MVSAQWRSAIKSVPRFHQLTSILHRAYRKTVGKSGGLSLDSVLVYNVSRKASLQRADTGESRAASKSLGEVEC
jgi:hypothetical protein